ncbi:hypothetical protein B0H17DRAFT_1196610 [Mycena rosella]|uniref:Uncharacterized protein n=1 Tax=Mycena rosella TaxID=1033263 RepID=A0AAD7GNB4_MYCRO|nr:hypothetical protein B0H17DRAFT_1196610 [Mycena rosella]
MTATTPVLPPELERAIFELAAHTDPKAIPTLLLLAQRVRIWLEPLLYRVLQLGTGGAEYTGMILEAIKTKPAPFLVSNVQNVLLHPCAGLNWVSLLESCPGIVNLVLLGSVACPSLLPLLGSMHVQRLTGSLARLFGRKTAVDWEHPLFGSVTHIYLLDWITMEEEIWMKHLSTLPALTHLAFTRPDHSNLLRNILGVSPRLQVLLVLFHSQEAGGASLFLDEIDFSDVRLVVGMYVDDYFADWERGARGGEDIWIRADGFVARKRRGEIKEDRYLMVDSE